MQIQYYYTPLAIYDSVQKREERCNQTREVAVRRSAAGLLYVGAWWWPSGGA